MREITHQYSITINHVFLSSCLLLITSCAHYYLPVSHLETPEARGTGKIGRVELIGILAQNDLTTKPTLSTPDTPDPDDPNADPPDPAVPEVQKSYMGAFGFGIPYSDKLDLAIRLQPQSPLTLRAKYQLSGDPETKAAKENLSTAVSFATGILIGTSDGSSTSFYTADLAFISGYRVLDHTLVSLSPFLTFAQLSSPGQNAADTPGSASATQYGICLGYQHQWEDLMLRSEITYAKGSVGESQIGDLFFGALLGLGL
jgi:hypothetical protein